MCMVCFDHINMELVYVLAALAILNFIEMVPLSYQYISLITTGEDSETVTQNSPKSFLFSDEELSGQLQFQNNGGFTIPYINTLTIEENNGHITPDFSNGLAYADHFLLTGSVAERAVSNLYQKPLFFGDVNHFDSLLRHQEQRKRNGLRGHKLGSLRPHLPFYRFKYEKYRSYI